MVTKLVDRGGYYWASFELNPIIDLGYVSVDSDRSIIESRDFIDEIASNSNDNGDGWDAKLLRRLASSCKHGLSTWDSN